MKAHNYLTIPLKQKNGYILINVLIFIVLVSLTLVPVINYIGVGHKSGQLFQEEADDFYTADAGIEDAKWQIKNGRLSIIFPSPNIYNQFDFREEPPWHGTGKSSTDYGIYVPSEVGIYDNNHKSSINNRNVNVSIKNKWVISNVSAPDTPALITQAQNIIQTAKLIVVGSDPQGQTDTFARKYQLEITYYPASGENLILSTIGVWLPPGFSYYPVDETHPFQINGQNYNPGTPVSTSFAGGTSVLWTLPANTLFRNMPGINISDNPMKIKATLWYRYDKTGKETSTIAQAVGWLTTSGVSSIPYSWDASNHVMKLTSTSVSTSATTVDALIIHQDSRPIGGSVNGDYYATGNSILGGNSSTHDRLYNSNTAVVATSNDLLSGVPSNSRLQAAYLYWSGWIDWNHYNPYGSSDITITPPGIEDGVSFISSPGPSWAQGSRWTQNVLFSNQRVFQGRGYSGTIDSNWDLTSATVDLSTYTGKTVVVVWDQAKGGTLSTGDTLICEVSNNAGGSWTNLATITSTGLTSALTTYTSQPIPVTINSTMKIRFKFNFTSTSKYVYLKNIKFVQPGIFLDTCTNLTKWTQSGATWSVYNNANFKGIGGGLESNSYLTMANALNLTTYQNIGLALSWDNISDTFTSNDILYFSFFGDGTGQWSADISAFDATSPSGYVSYLIPDSYKTTNFKMRFKISSGSSLRYVNIDNIAISGPTLKYPTNATSGSVNNLVENVAKVNKVRFGAGANIQTITATKYQVLPTTGGGNYTGTWAYTAIYDATSLIKGWLGETTNGAATYTFGHVVASNTEDPAYSKTFNGGGTTGYPLASPYYSGVSPSDIYAYTYGSWAIVLIYSSEQTAGHQLWLYDIINPNFKFSEAWINAERDNPDFDGDGLDGGIISGFLVPQGIEAEANSSKITVFVGEGDAGISGDSFQVNSVKLTNGVSTDPNNVWDWKSQPIPSSGGDIDTFFVNYPVLQPGDTHAHIDMPTGSDGFTLIFIIISFRSDSITGGTISYLIR